MSDASQDVPEEPVGERLADLIENMLNEWPAERKTAKITLEMAFGQWNELLSILRLHQGDEALRLVAEASR